MLRHTSTKSKALHGGLSGTLYSSVRCVHWYHDYNYAAQSKDRYELYNREREFGQDEITDKDRNPHLYWGIWQGRTMVQRVINQWGFSKELKPEKVKRDFEKFTYFGKLDALDFLQNDRSNYPWMGDAADDDALGYNTDDGDTDTRYTHNDYGKLYKDASGEFRDMVLRDHCHGRPVYEWQVPYGLDEAYGYQEVSTSVDVLGNDSALNNLSFDWSVSGGSENVKNATVLTHNLTGQKVLFCDLKEASHAIHQFHPSTVVMPCGAEKLLYSVRNKFAPSSRTDLYGTAVGLVWTGLWMISDYWPTEGFISFPLGTALLAVNGISIYRTFIHHHDSQYKAAFAACREAECNVVLGDWLLDDYDERQHVAQQFDEAADNANSEGKKSYLPDFIKQTDEKGTGFTNTLRAMKDEINRLMFSDPHDQKTVDEMTTDSWMSSYRDAVNNRRLDLLAHVLNNVEGDKIVMPITNIDNIPTDIATSLLVRRMTGNIPIESSPMKFDAGFERVGIEFE